MDLKELKEIESALKVELPNFYKNFMKEYPDFLLETEAEDFDLVNYASKLIEENQNAKVNFFYDRPLKKDVFIIGENGSGDYFMIKLNGSEAVYSFCHDIEKFHKIADSLLGFSEQILDSSYESKWCNPDLEIEDLREELIIEESKMEIKNVKIEKQTFFEKLKNLFS